MNKKIEARALFRALEIVLRRGVDETPYYHPEDREVLLAGLQELKQIESVSEGLSGLVNVRHRKDGET